MTDESSPVTRTQSSEESPMPPTNGAKIPGALLYPHQYAYLNEKRQDADFRARQNALQTERRRKKKSAEDSKSLKDESQQLTYADSSEDPLSIPGAILYRHQYVYLKKRLHNDEEVRAKHNALQLERRNKKLAEDPGYREHIRKLQRENNKKRYNEDPQYREKVKARNRASKERKKHSVDITI